MSKKVVKYDNNKRYLGNISVSEITRDSSLIRFHYNVDTIAIENDLAVSDFDGIDFSGNEIINVGASHLNSFTSFLLVSCPSDETKCGVYLITSSNTCIKQDISFVLGDLVSITQTFSDADYIYSSTYQNTIWQYKDTNKFIPMFLPKDFTTFRRLNLTLNASYQYISELELDFDGGIYDGYVEFDLVVQLAETPQSPFTTQFLAFQFDIVGIGTHLVYVNAYDSGGYNLSVKSDTAYATNNYFLTTERGIDPAFVYPRLNFIKLQLFIKEIRPDGTGDPMKVKLKLKCGGSGPGAIGSNLLLYGSVNKKILNNFNSINY